MTLLVAGSDTTVHAISLGALSLIEHPDVPPLACSPIRRSGTPQ